MERVLLRADQIARRLAETETAHTYGAKINIIIAVMASANARWGARIERELSAERAREIAKYQTKH